MAKYMFQFVESTKIPTSVKVWLVTGLVMIFLQIVIGGVTRLTGSGLSITRWEVVSGVIPPLTATDWEQAFDLYKETPQYHKINQGMSMSEFKFIYFWEYFHRFWARLMFFVFVIPFVWFLFKGKFARWMIPSLLTVVFLAALEGFFGWIMVYSGLIKRPWVNAYNLTLHLCMALIIYSYLLWITFKSIYPNPPVFHNQVLKRFSWGLAFLTFLQIALGAMMSGTKAGLFYPSWPDIGGAFLPEILLDFTHWETSSFINYDTNAFMPALLHFLHRNTAYLLVIMVFYFSWRLLQSSLPKNLKVGVILLVSILVLQVTLGILTLINCIGHIPVTLGVLHQAVAVLFLSAILFVTYQFYQREYAQL